MLKWELGIHIPYLHIPTSQINLIKIIKPNNIF